jgi:hypothetical protein
MVLLDMIQFIKTYKAFGIGYALIIPIFCLLDYIGFLIIPDGQFSEILIYAFFWGTVLGLIIHFAKEKKIAVIKVIGLLSLFILTMKVDKAMGLPDNPITVILLAAFWLGFVHFLIPNFIKKYWRLIAVVYGTILLYFLYFRLFSGDLETYLSNRQDFPFYLLFMPIPLLFLLWTYEQWKWIQKLKADKSEAELSMLRSQVNPHFFFNTLNNLYALSIKKSDEAPAVILKLSEMMRYTIYEGKKEWVTLGDEIEYLNNYIELHKIRYKKSVDIAFTQSIDNSLTVAPLLFIILLENAFKHGIETLSENAYIHLNLTETDDSIIFEIENNYDLDEINTEHGIGLENLQRRLSLLYKNKYKMLVTNENETYKVSLNIPKNA